MATRFLLDMILRLASLTGILFLTGYSKRKKLTMLEIPSIFIPEDWSFTFYEGINRHSDSIFKDKTVVELGCGNGWISIALAEKWLPLKVCFTFSVWVFFLGIAFNREPSSVHLMAFHFSFSNLLCALFFNVNAEIFLFLVIFLL